MRIDDRRNGLRRNAFHLVENRLAVAGSLRVHENHSAFGDECGRVSGAKHRRGDHVEIVFNFLNFETGRRILQSRSPQ